MPISSPSSPSLIPQNQASAGSVKSAAAQIGKIGGDDASAWAATSAALTSIQRQLDQHQHALQQAIPIPNPLQITAPDGSLIAEIGNIVDPNTNVSYSGIWGNNLFIGGGGPGNAPLYSNGKQVVLGHNGQVYILDPYANVGAWLGTQSEAPQNVTGSANDGFAQVQLTVTAHGYRNGDWVNVASVGGVPNATGQWVISNVAANTFSLTGSTWAGTYASGGTAQRYFSGGSFETIAIAAGKRITNAVNNGSGLVRLTITAHGYSTGYAVTTTNVNGVPGANGTFLVTVINANTFDLQGSVFSGAYVSGGISINWPTAKLLAQGDGSLRITDALITLTHVSGTTTSSIVIDPTNADIVVQFVNSVTGGQQIILQDGKISLNTLLPNGAIDLNSSYSQIQPGLYNAIATLLTTLSSSQVISITGFSDTTAFGPTQSFAGYRGSPTAAVAVQLGDTLGGFLFDGYDGATTQLPASYTAAMRAIAAETFTDGGSTNLHGTKLIFEATPTGGSTTPSTVMDLSPQGVGIYAPLYVYEPLQIDTGATPANNQITLKANGLGCVSLLCYSAANGLITIGAEWTGSAWVARDPIVVRIAKTAGGLFAIQGSAGNAVGASPTFNNFLTIDPSTGYVTVAQKLSSYNGAATAGIGTTPVYAAVSLTNQSANNSGNIQVGGAIAPAGQYRLSYYAATRTAGAGNVALTFGWNDGISAKTYPAILTLIANAVIQSAGQCIVTSGASNITYSAVYTATGAYDLYISLERLA